ncbi:hypothetical protein BDV95DRAFT_345619 [Massariosphaeria phaeospora]|uniref:Uncharacterized protein n=1 Tax=Massariosphaeria phaeospora TaxID=100035 RepID=A0A7C8IGB7_9PLEO|nr:hypothetical protein BDV95DRAFT_345619 [Massariosphaeria phaeospora]
MILEKLLASFAFMVAVVAASVPDMSAAEAVDDVFANPVTAAAAAAEVVPNTGTAESIMDGTTGNSLAAQGILVCRFRLQLLQFCTTNDDEGFHVETLGQLYYIETTFGQHLVRYPWGAGRIDGRIKKLNHVGSLNKFMLITYHRDNRAWFRFNSSNRCTWHSENNDKTTCGQCDWLGWVTPPLHCDATTLFEIRRSAMWCYFKCLG